MAWLNRWMSDARSVATDCEKVSEHGEPTNIIVHNRQVRRALTFVVILMRFYSLGPKMSDVLTTNHMISKAQASMRSTMLITLGWAMFASLAAPGSCADPELARPNILWLSCEDISPHLGCYGDPHAITPNLDRLASEGTRYTRVFTAAGVCAPCRSTIITGMYHNSIGTHHMRCKSRLPEWLKPFPMRLREAGYYCCNNSKTDYQFASPSSKEIWDESSGRAHWKKRPADQPFFAVFNFGGCHESGIAGREKYEKVTEVLSAEQRQDAARLTTLPPYYPDNEVTREDWKRNYELITAMDHWAGEHIQELKEAGLYEDTIIVFWSDHGIGLPRAKRWLYDSGTRIPFMVRIPEKYRHEGQGQPASTVTDLVSSVDFAPTMLSLAGVDIPEYMHGRAFLGAATAPPPEYVYGARDRMDERYDIIRAVRGTRFRYIRNFEPLKPYYQYMNTPEKGATMREIRRAEEDGSLPMSARQFSLGHKPVEELYDLSQDPHEIRNLAADPEYQDQLTAMRVACLRWQAEVGDLGLVPEAEIELRDAEMSRYEILRSEDDELLTRLVDVAALASNGPEATSKLLVAANHQVSSVRYWSATGLGNIAREQTDPALSRKTLQVLQQLVQDESPSVRIAAARGLCRIGNVDQGLKVLRSELAGPHQWARLAAAIVLDELDEVARPALPALQAALEDQPNKYIVRVANKAVNDLLGTENKVP